MYDLVDRLDEETAYRLSRQAFEEMLDAGFTSVGEFHYIHHAPGSKWALDTAVLSAASDAGIRLVLLHADYCNGAINEPLQGAQRRFDTGKHEDYLASLDEVASKLQGELQTLGMVCHSIRAVRLDRFLRMREEARRRDMVFHMHLEEVVQEIEASQVAYGANPMRLMLDNGVIDERTTAVHCTHSSSQDIAEFGRAGGNVCLCPLTEGNLGDGIADIPAMRAAGCAISIGTDMNSRISPIEELRWMEYVQRLALQVRGVVHDASALTGPALIECGTAHGARALGLECGVIEAGRLADFVAVDLAHPTLQGVAPEELASAIIFGTGNESVVGTCVGGRWLRGGPDEENIRR